jgi:hypothetical protein
VNTYRPWFVSNIFDRHDWYLLKSGKISYGSVEENRKQDPLMPVVVESFFLIRNLTLTSSWFKEHKAEFAKKIEAHAKVDVGPFSGSFDFLKKDEGKSGESSFDDGSITAPGIQIIAYLGSIPRLAPDPDLTLKGAPKS